MASSSWSYDVFLSFRGEDTRNNFTAHLYKELRTKGINTFIDDDKLERGQVISPALVRAIENSMFSIIVLSENYASSKWCLEELVKILECMKTRETVLPIFYNVDPSDVRKHRGKFGEALAKHEENLENMERVQIWKDALTQVANFSGWDSRNQNESLLIKNIVNCILKKLLSIFPGDTEKLVGMDARIRDIKMQLCLESDDVLMIGIWGMGGIGKTTLARALYNKISSQFEAHSFLENVGEVLAKKGLIKLQQKFLSQLLEEEDLNMKELTSIKARLHSKKVLVVLDNVKDPKILECLVGNRDWFGRESRIIITARDKYLFPHGVINYEVQIFNDDEAREFIEHHSLKHELLRGDFKELSTGMMDYAQGLPLALKILCPLLFSMSKEEWRDQLDKLKSTPNKKIEEVLKISYDELDDKEKKIFLDIACFFKGEDKDYVIEILDGCGFFPLCGIRSLIDKSLISINDCNEFEMHDLIQDMGMKIEHQQELGKRSRLWSCEDICDVLKKNMGNEKIEGISLNSFHLKETIDFTTQAFARMSKLRLLKVYQSNEISRNFVDTSKKDFKVHFSWNFKFCYDELRYLDLYGYSLKSLPNDFNAENLVHLSMPCSRIKQLWKGIKVLENLKCMDLSHSEYLIETPNLSRVTNLERLVLEGCVSLCKVHSSLGAMKNLKFLSLKNCKRLKGLPSSTYDLKSLRTFILSGCSKFEQFPENFGNLEMLEVLHLDRTALIVPPSSFSLLRNLGVLSSSWLLPRRSPDSILHHLSGLCSLRNLDLSDCNLSDETNLRCLGLLSSLKELSLGGNNFVTLPNISQLSQLEYLKLENCQRLQELPDLPSDIRHVDARNCTSLQNVWHQTLVAIKSLDANSMWWTSEIYEDSVIAALQVMSAGSRIPDWMGYQSSGSEVTAELPPNWFNSNFLGFGFSVVIGAEIHPEVNSIDYLSLTFFYSTSSHFACQIHLVPFLNPDGRTIESDNVCLLYVSYPSLSAWSQFDDIDMDQVTRIRASFEIYSGNSSEIKRCGIGLVYSNEDVNHNHPPMIQFSSISSPPPPPPPPPPNNNNSTVVLTELHKWCASADSNEDVNCNHRLMIPSFSISSRRLPRHPPTPPSPPRPRPRPPCPPAPPPPNNNNSTVVLTEFHKWCASADSNEDVNYNHRLMIPFFSISAPRCRPPTPPPPPPPPPNESTAVLTDIHQMCASADSNEDENHNHPLMIQFSSISSPPPPPPNKSTVVLIEIHEEEPSASADDSELDNSKYHTANEVRESKTKPSIAAAKGSHTTPEVGRNEDNDDNPRESDPGEAFQGGVHDESALIVLPQDLPSELFKQQSKVKRSHELQSPYTDPNKRRKVEGSTSMLE